MGLESANLDVTCIALAVNGASDLHQMWSIIDALIGKLVYSDWDMEAVENALFVLAYWGVIGRPFMITECKDMLSKCVQVQKEMRNVDMMDILTSPD